MSILISDATGSKDLADAISQRPGHPDVELCSMRDMPYGDVVIPFNGPNDSVFVIGIEVKKLADVLQCIQNGRFAGHQLIGLTEPTTFDEVILLIEGTWRMGPETGLLETFGWDRGSKKLQWKSVSYGARGWMFREFNRWLLSMQLVAGIQVMRAPNRAEVVQTLLDIHALGEKEWSQHKSVRVHNQTILDQLRFRYAPNGRRMMRFDEPTLVEKVAAQLTGVGVERAGAVAKRFKSIREMVDADEKSWREIEGVGKKLSRTLREELNGK